MPKENDEAVQKFVEIMLRQRGLDEPTLMQKYMQEAVRKLEELKAQGVPWDELPHDKLMEILFRNTEQGG